VLDYRFISIAEQVQALKRGDISASDYVTEACRAIDALNPVVNAITTRWDEDALERAAALDGSTTRDGALWGLPTADKDLVNRAGYATRWGSRATSHWPVADTSDPMASWLDGHGALSVGKTATSEFGLTGYTETAAFGATRNPHNETLGAGGSSGGAAVAVASGMLPFAPGSDGGGSIRIPALACGVVGLKPSRGRVPAQSGLESLSQMVVPGVIARTVADVAYVSDALFAGEYRWAVAAPPLSSALFDAVSSPPTRLRIGVTTTTPWADEVECPVAPEAMAALDSAIAALRDAGHEVEQWPWTPLPGYFQAFSVMWQASTTGTTFSDDEFQLLEPLTKFLVSKGLGVSGADLVRTTAWLRRFEYDTISQMAGFDAILTPGLATTPPPVGWYDESDPERNFLQQIQVTPFTSFVNVCGLPALALPSHYTSNNIPMGVQLVGPPGRDDTVIALGRDIEQRVNATRWPTHTVVSG
jgi:amidase